MRWWKRHFGHDIQHGVRTWVGSSFFKYSPLAHGQQLWLAIIRMFVRRIQADNEKAGM
jgi:hypothetical protein